MSVKVSTYNNIGESYLSATTIDTTPLSIPVNVNSYNIISIAYSSATNIKVSASFIPVQVSTYNNIGESYLSATTIDTTPLSIPINVNTYNIIGVAYSSATNIEVSASSNPIKVSTYNNIGVAYSSASSIEVSASSNPVNVSTYNWVGLAYVSAVSEIAASAIPSDFFTSGAVSGISTDQNFTDYLNGTCHQDVIYTPIVVDFSWIPEGDVFGYNIGIDPFNFVGPYISIQLTNLTTGLIEGDTILWESDDRFMVENTRLRTFHMIYPIDGLISDTYSDIINYDNEEHWIRLTVTRGIDTYSKIKIITLRNMLI